jgi:hypothetical protein
MLKPRASKRKGARGWRNGRKISVNKRIQPMCDESVGLIGYQLTGFCAPPHIESADDFDQDIFYGSIW